MKDTVSRYRLRLTVMTALFAAIIVILMLTSRVDAAELMQPTRLVDGHTAGVVPKGHVDAELRVYPPAPTSGALGSGLLLGMQVGITPRFTIGLSYGGEGIIGYGDKVVWNRYPGAMAKYRVFEERFATPAVALGIDVQGFGGNAHESHYDYEGYIYKSPGFFVALSKSFTMLSAVQIGFHGTVNYSLEDTDNVTWPNLLAGADIGINEELKLVAEYNFAFDDITGGGDSQKHVRPFHGILNVGLRWAFTPNFHLEFDVKDIFENKTVRAYRLPNDDGWYRRPIGWSRELKVVYITKF